MTTYRFHPCLPALLAMTMLYASVAARADTGEPSRTAAADDRPRIGLVLGGGGARGAAHVGVLRELERLHVPIDAIAGTSMGAMIGGLYASGVRAAELEELIRTIDWADAMSDAPRRKDLNLRRKEDGEQFPVKFDVGVSKDGFKVPMGLIQGHRLNLLLHELTTHVADIDDFDRLPIPFRAVAADVETAEAHVIGGGDLARAMRASMSVPGILAPTVIGKHLLVDGGLVGNLPIEVMREMDVDIIIAVDAEFPLYARDRLDSALKISEQMLTILIRKETRRQIDTMNQQDILIRPELGTFASTNFGKIMSTIEPGAQAAVAVTDRLQALALSEQDYAAYAAGRGRPRQAAATLDFVRVIHDGRLAARSLQNRVLVKAGDPVDAKRMAADADRLYGLGMYQRVGYRLVSDEAGRGVEYRAITKSWGSNDLLFGLTLEDNLEGETSLNLGTRLTRVGVNSRGAEWRTDLQIGTDPLAFTEFYQPFAAGSRWFIAPRLELSKSNLNAFVSENQAAKLRISEAEAGLDVGRQIGYSGEIRLGVYRSAGESAVRIGDPALTNMDFDSGGLFAGMRLDTLDNPYFPRQGMRADLQWKASRKGLGADSRFDAFSADLSKTWSYGRSSIDLGISYATISDGSGAPQELFTLGGFQRLSGLERGSISGPHAALARLVYRRRTSETAGGLLDTPIYLGASLEAGNVWQQRSDIGLGSALVNGSVFAGLDTFLGPVFLGAGFAEGGRGNYYLLIGAVPR